MCKSKLGQNRFKRSWIISLILFIAFYSERNAKDFSADFLMRIFCQHYQKMVIQNCSASAEDEYQWDLEFGKCYFAYIYLYDWQIQSYWRWREKYEFNNFNALGSIQFGYNGLSFWVSQLTLDLLLGDPGLICGFFWFATMLNLFVTYITLSQYSLR